MYFISKKKKAEYVQLKQKIHKINNKNNLCKREIAVLRDKLSELLEEKKTAV